MKNLVSAMALLATAAWAQIDPTILVSGNSWLHRQVIEEGPTVPRLVFDGVTFTRLDTIFWRNDTAYFSTTSKDSSYLDGSTSAYQIEYAVTDGKTSELGINGSRPRHLESGLPWFMVGSDLSGTLSYARYDGKIRFHNQWAKSPGPTYGTTVIISYLQGIGLIGYSRTDFGPLARGKSTLQLLETNGKPFDSSKVEKLGPVTQVKPSPKKALGMRNSPYFSLGAREYQIDGKRVRVRKEIP